MPAPSPRFRSIPSSGRWCGADPESSLTWDKIGISSHDVRYSRALSDGGECRHQLFASELDDGRAGVSGSVIDEECVLGLDDPGGKDDVRYETRALELGGRFEDRIGRAAEDPRGVLRVQQQGAGGALADRARRGRVAAAVIDLQPALRNPDRRRPGADASGLPVRTAAMENAVMAPVDDVLGPGDPHLGTAERRGRVGPVQGRMRTTDPVGKQDNILVLTAEDRAFTREVEEIGRQGQGRGR